MKTLINTLIILICSNWVIAQNTKTLYKVDGQSIKEIVYLYKYKSPSIYNVVLKGGTRKTSVSVKKKSDKYIRLEKEIEALEKEKEIVEGGYYIELTKYDDINLIIKGIGNFSKSPEPFEKKKELLIDAQLTADVYNIKDLIYADDVINTKNKPKFKLLAFNELDLKVHLHRVVGNIKKGNVKPDKPYYDDSKLIALKEELTKTDPFYYIEKEETKATRKIKVLGSKLDYSNNFSGFFYNIGEVYLVKKAFKNILKTNQILYDEEVNLWNINIDEVDYDERTLIKSKENNSYYLVPDNFLNRFARRY